MAASKKQGKKRVTRRIFRKPVPKKQYAPAPVFEIPSSSVEKKPSAPRPKLESDMEMNLFINLVIAGFFALVFLVILSLLNFQNKFFCAAVFWLLLFLVVHLFRKFVVGKR